MKAAHLLLFGLVWRGLFLGVEQTAPWRSVLWEPGVSVSATAIASAGRMDLRVVYIQPMRGEAPALVQVGASVRVF